MSLKRHGSRKQRRRCLAPTGLALRVMNAIPSQPMLVELAGRCVPCALPGVMSPDSTRQTNQFESNVTTLLCALCSMSRDRERDHRILKSVPPSRLVQRSHRNALGKLARLRQACPPACVGKGVVVLLMRDEIPVKRAKSLLNLHGDVNLDLRSKIEIGLVVHAVSY